MITIADDLFGEITIDMPDDKRTERTLAATIRSGKYGAGLGRTSSLTYTDLAQGYDAAAAGALVNGDVAASERYADAARRMRETSVIVRGFGSILNASRTPGAERSSVLTRADLVDLALAMGNRWSAACIRIASDLEMDMTGQPTLFDAPADANAPYVRKPSRKIATSARFDAATLKRLDAKLPPVHVIAYGPVGTPAVAPEKLRDAHSSTNEPWFRAAPAVATWSTTPATVTAPAPAPITPEVTVPTTPATVDQVGAHAFIRGTDNAHRCGVAGCNRGRAAKVHAASYAAERAATAERMPTDAPAPADVPAVTVPADAPATVDQVDADAPAGALVDTAPAPIDWTKALCIVHGIGFSKHSRRPLECSLCGRGEALHPYSEGQPTVECACGQRVGLVGTVDPIIGSHTLADGSQCEHTGHAPAPADVPADAPAEHAPRGMAASEDTGIYPYRAVWERRHGGPLVAPMSAVGDRTPVRRDDVTVIGTVAYEPGMVRVRMADRSVARALVADVTPTAPAEAPADAPATVDQVDTDAPAPTVDVSGVDRPALALVARGTWSLAMVGKRGAREGVHVLSLPRDAGRLSRESYLAVKAIAERIGGHWNREVRGFVFAKSRPCFPNGYTVDGRATAEATLAALVDAVALVDGDAPARAVTAPADAPAEAPADGAGALVASLAESLRTAIRAAGAGNLAHVKTRTGAPMSSLITWCSPLVGRMPAGTVSTPSDLVDRTTPVTCPACSHLVECRRPACVWCAAILADAPADLVDDVTAPAPAEVPAVTVPADAPVTVPAEAPAPVVTAPASMPAPITQEVTVPTTPATVTAPPATVPVALATVDQGAPATASVATMTAPAERYRADVRDRGEVDGYAFKITGKVSKGHAKVIKSALFAERDALGGKFWLITSERGTLGIVPASDADAPADWSPVLARVAELLAAPADV